MKKTNTNAKKSSSSKDTKLPKIGNNKQKSKEPIHFLEFDFLEENDIIIIIEHCANCEKHINHTNHSNDIFINSDLNNGLHYFNTRFYDILFIFIWSKVFLKTSLSKG